MWVFEKAVSGGDALRNSREDIEMKELIVTAVCLLLPICASARMITVDDDEGADFRNIQAAVADSDDGDVVAQPVPPF